MPCQNGSRSVKREEMPGKMGTSKSTTLHEDTELARLDGDINIITYHMLG